MPGGKHDSQDKPTLLEVVLLVHGDFRNRLASIGVTPLQSGVMLNLQRHSDAKMNDTSRRPTIQLRIRLWRSRNKGLHGHAYPWSASACLLEPECRRVFSCGLASGHCSYS
jgi:hypothetical protein